MAPMLTAIPSTRGTSEGRTGTDRWRDNAEALYHYQRRDMRDALEQRKDLYPDTYASQVLRTVPFIWALCRELCTPYLDTVARRFVRRDTGAVADGDVLALIEDVYTSIDVDAALHEAHEHLVAIGSATIHVWPDPLVRSCRLLNIPPHDQEVRQGDSTSLEVRDLASWRFRMAVGEDEWTGIPRWALGEITATRAQWVGGTKVLHNRGIFGLGGIANPIGQIPVVMLRATRPAPGEWWPPVPEDILQGQRAVNHDVTDVGHVARLQGYAQPKMSGVKVAKARDQKLGPETIVVVEGEDADFDFARPEPDLEGYLAQNSAYMRDLVSASGLNPQSFMKSAGITALAKQIELIDRQAARKIHFKELRRAEQRVFDLVRLWINYLRGGEVIPDCRVEVEYREPIIPADPLHDAQAVEKMIQLGLTSEYRERAKLDGISLDEARRRVDEDADNSAALARMRGGHPSTAADAPAAVVADDVAKTALNGAQVTALQGLLAEVSARRLPSAAAREVVMLAFPDFDPASVDRMLAAIDAVPRPAEPPPAPASQEVKQPDDSPDDAPNDNADDKVAA